MKCWSREKSKTTTAKRKLNERKKKQHFYCEPTYSDKSDTHATNNTMSARARLVLHNTHRHATAAVRVTEMREHERDEGTDGYLQARTRRASVVIVKWSIKHTYAVRASQRATNTPLRDATDGIFLFDFEGGPHFI